MNFEKLRPADDPEPEYGFGVHWFLESFNETFYKSARDSFTAYFKEYANVKKWMVFSDYVLHDKNKANDVMVFSIVPYTYDFNEFSDLLNDLSPRDLKKSRSVSPNFIKFLSSGPVLNIGVVLNKKRRLHSDEKRYYEVKFEMMVKQLEHWCRTTPEASEHYNDLISKLEVLRNSVISPGANMKVIRDIEVLATLAAYIMFEISKLTDVQRIGWFSDRDSMLSFKAAKLKSPFILDMVHHLYYLFCESEGIDSKGKLVLGVPRNGSDGTVWYDSFNRIPDVLAGTLADYHYEKNRNSHGKYIPVVEEVLTSRERNLFFLLKLSKEKYLVSRLEFSRAQHETSEHGTPYKPSRNQ